MPAVYNVKRWHPVDAVLVDRTTPFGNKFRVVVYGRDEAIRLYFEWIWRKEQFWLRSMMRRELHGKDLMCHCLPERCHAPIVHAIANGWSKRQCKRWLSI